MKLLYGTGNGAKLDAMRRTVAGLDIEIIGLKDMNAQAPEVSEDGATPLENARAKARAYFETFGVPVFSCDSGLYFEGLPDEMQPGTRVRNVDGRRLSDDEMIERYSALARRFGPLNARYRNAICLILSRDSTFESMDEAIASQTFIIAATPHKKRVEGFPIDSLSIDPQTGKYYYDMDTARALDDVCQAIGFRRFFIDALSVAR